MDVATDGRGGLSFNRKAGPLEVVARACGAKPVVHLVVAVRQEPHGKEPQLSEEAADLLTGQATRWSRAPETPPPGERAADGVGRSGSLLDLPEDRRRNEIEDLLAADRGAEHVDEVPFWLSLGQRGAWSVRGFHDCARR